MEKYYITTPIYYVNDKLILDMHIQQYLQIQFQDLALIGEKPTFLTGLDEHG